jgi:hypothetical protein
MRGEAHSRCPGARRDCATGAMLAGLATTADGAGCGTGARWRGGVPACQTGRCSSELPPPVASGLSGDTAAGSVSPVPMSASRLGAMSMRASQPCKAGMPAPRMHARAASDTRGKRCSARFRSVAARVWRRPSACSLAAGPGGDQREPQRRAQLAGMRAQQAPRRRGQDGEDQAALRAQVRPGPATVRSAPSPVTRAGDRGFAGVRGCSPVWRLR